MRAGRSGSRTARGRSRWYLVQVREGRERTFCERVRRVLSQEVLTDAFVPMKERWVKRRGAWSIEAAPLYRGFFVAVAPDAEALAKALTKSSLPVRPAGAGAHAWPPLSEEARAWLEGAMDPQHVIRSSTAELVSGELRVLSGPLAGQERRVSKVDRHKRRCLVSVPDADGGFAVAMPLDVPKKS